MSIKVQEGVGELMTYLRVVDLDPRRWFRKYETVLDYRPGVAKYIQLLQRKSNFSKTNTYTAATANELMWSE